MLPALAGSRGGFELRRQPDLPGTVARIQRLAGNQAAARSLGRPPVRSVVQRHGDDELKKQIAASPEEDEGQVLQAKHDRAAGRIIRRHPIAPNKEIFHDAGFSKRKTADMLAIVQDAALQARIKKSLLKFVGENLTGAELKAKTDQVNAMSWTLDAATKANNPAQADASGIRLWYYHANWYNPDGSPRVEFIKSTMVHEGLHFISKNHEGFQGGEKFDPNSANDTLDEAVTDKIGAELAADVLGSTEAYTTSYWNIGGRKGLDFHLTFQGLETLANGDTKLWLGELIPIITAKTGLTWEAIKTAYLTDSKGENAAAAATIEGKRAEIVEAWKASKSQALKTQLGNHGIEKTEWETKLKASIAAVEATLKPADPTARTKEQLKAEIDAELAKQTGAPHEIVTKQDSRSCSADDWKLVRDNTSKLTPPPPKTKAAVWTETNEQTTGGKGIQPTTADAQKELAEKHHDASKYYKLAAIPDIKLREYVERANRLLGGIATKHPLGWVIVPDDPSLKGNTPFSAYPRLATRMLQPQNMTQSLSSLTGAGPGGAAHEIVEDFGGAGYETNGDVGMVNIKHVNLATVVHEMGHHMQKYEKNFSEDNVNQVKGSIPLLDLHNILYSENRIAAAELRRDPAADPFVRLRYTEKPVRMRLSEWVKAAAGQAEGEDYKRFKARLQLKGGSVLAILTAIEQELAANPLLYPGNVPTLFKNLMVKEVRMRSKEVEPTDASK